MFQRPMSTWPSPAAPAAPAVLQKTHSFYPFAAISSLVNLNSESFPPAPTTAMKITTMSSKSAVYIKFKPVFSGYQVWNPGILTGPGIKEPTRLYDWRQYPAGMFQCCVDILFFFIHPRVRIYRNFQFIYPESKDILAFFISISLRFGYMKFMVSDK